MADAAFSKALAIWSVFAHVNENSRRFENGFSRHGSSTDVDFPIILQNFNPMPFMPTLAPAHLPRSQSGDTLKMLPRGRPTTARNHLQSSSIYLRGFISTYTSPTPVGHVITGYEPPKAINATRTRFSPESRPFIIQVALRSAFPNTHEYDLVTRLRGELRRAFGPTPVDEVLDPPENFPG